MDSKQTLVVFALLLALCVLAQGKAIKPGKFSGLVSPIATLYYGNNVDDFDEESKDLTSEGPDDNASDGDDLNDENGGDDSNDESASEIIYSINANTSVINKTYEGDIVIDPDREAEVAEWSNGTSITKRAARKNNYRWPNNRLFYYVHPNSNVYRDGRYLRQAIAEIQAKSCVRFQRVWTTRTNQYFVLIHSGKGCSSNVGMIKGGSRRSQTLSIGLNCNAKSVIIHELLHALGFWHEQSRPDRDNYVNIIYQNIKPGYEGNFKKHIENIEELGTTYDLDSIMHYGNKYFTKNGRNTIQRKNNPQIALSHTGGMSELDALDLNRYYGCPVSCKARTKKGQCCVFPFKFSGKEYRTCTQDGANVLWCATSSNYDKHRMWGECAACNVMTTRGQCCFFPFRFNGKLYNQCTKDGYSRPWCATSSSYDTDGVWGVCGSQATCRVKTTRGQCCVFPFRFGGKLYHTCTSYGHSKRRQWCATTSSFDRDGKWGECGSSFGR